MTLFYLKKKIYLSRFFYAILILAVPLNLLANDEYGFSLEAGSNILGRDTLSYRQARVEKQDSSGGLTQTVESPWRNYFFLSQGFYNNYLVRAFARLEPGVSGDFFENGTLANSTGTTVVEAPGITEIGLMAGLRWFKRGGRSYFSLLGGWTRISFQGFSGSLNGSSHYYNATLKLSPSWQIIKSLDWGLDFELTIGQMFHGKGTKIMGQDPFSLFLPYEDSGFLGSANLGINFFIVPLGIYLQTKVRQRYFNITVNGLGSDRISFSNMDISMIEISLGYFYSRPGYNK